MLVAWNIQIPAHASSGVSHVKKQTTITSFFKGVTFAVVWKPYSGFVYVPFACMWLKGVHILAKRPVRLGGYKIFFGGDIWGGGGGQIRTPLTTNALAGAVDWSAAAPHPDPFPWSRPLDIASLPTPTPPQSHHMGITAEPQARAQGSAWGHQRPVDSGSRSSRGSGDKRDLCPYGTVAPLSFRAYSKSRMRSSCSRSCCCSC